jgi:hypothetical protein
MNAGTRIDGNHANFSADPDRLRRFEQEGPNRRVAQSRRRARESWM